MLDRSWGNVRLPTASVSAIAATASGAEISLESQGSELHAKAVQAECAISLLSDLGTNSVADIYEDIA
jgi:hypothetical protein